MWTFVFDRYTSTLLNPLVLILALVAIFLGEPARVKVMFADEAGHEMMLE